MQKCSDCFEVAMNKLGWNFKWTYKSHLRTICCCCNNFLIRKVFEEYQPTEEDMEMFVLITETMIALPDGRSEDMFF